MAHATILSTMVQPDEQSYWDANYWDAVTSRDGRMDGIFYYAVLTTGVYCRPSCHSRLPNRENVIFFQQRTGAEDAGFRACKRCHPQRVVRPDPHVEMVLKICRSLEASLDQPTTLSALSKQFGMSPFHIQRTFKSVIGISPRAYADACRLRELKHGLKSGRPVTTAMYDAGYGSSSRLYERTGAQLGMTPATYRKHGAGSVIRYSIANSALGPVLVACTEKGVCAIQFDATAGDLRREYPAAVIVEEENSRHLEALLRQLEGGPAAKLPLDIQATAFQRRVWEHLQSIPRGSTQSYREVAQAIGEAKATRAVANACAANPVAVVVPCHRVIRGNGEPGGYRWGLARKQALLSKESEAK